MKKARCEIECERYEIPLEFRAADTLFRVLREVDRRHRRGLELDAWVDDARYRANARALLEQKSAALVSAAAEHLPSSGPAFQTMLTVMGAYRVLVGRTPGAVPAKVKSLDEALEAIKRIDEILEAL